jgi:hypothetical protein
VKGVSEYGCEEVTVSVQAGLHATGRLTNFKCRTPRNFRPPRYTGARKEEMDDVEPRCQVSQVSF